MWPSLEAELAVDLRVAELLQAHKQLWWQKERGGLLFADINSANGPTLVSATPPHVLDQAGWSWVELDQGRCKHEIEAANSRGERLVGYWHTHPQKYPDISRQDIKSFREFATRNYSMFPYPLSVIVGNGSTTSSVRAWSIRPDGVLLANQLPAYRNLDHG